MITREFRFLLTLWKTNLLALMEYRAAFISQMLGMMLNNIIYFVFWIIFFDRFDNVNGWALPDMFLLFGVVAGGIGLAMILFGNVTLLSEIISGGRMDYYLSLPRPALLHVISSRSVGSGYGDFLYGFISFFLAGAFTLPEFLRFLAGLLLSASIFTSFMIIANSLAFFLGNADMISRQAMNAIITFALYPITLFDGTAKLILLTVIPAAFVGAVPVEFIHAFSWTGLFKLLGASAVLLGLALFLFQRGLRRYESGSAIQVQL